MSETMMSGLRIGWGNADITPSEPVLLRGQFHARVSEGVADPITATALVLEQVEDGVPQDAVVMVSCDLVAIDDALRDAVRRRVVNAIPELNPMQIVLSATHTHTAPQVSSRGSWRIEDTMDDLPPFGVELAELGAMDPAGFLSFAVERIAAAVADAWEGRRPGSASWGLGQAVVGHCRLVAYDGAGSKMYGRTDDPGFSHMDGYTDHSLDVLATWSGDGDLTGLVINLACPSQVSESQYQVSADFWHETRRKLQQRYGEGLHILGQCAPAGDQSPRHPYRRHAEDRMLELKGRTLRQDIAARITAGVDELMPWLMKSREGDLPLRHRAGAVELSRRLLTEADVAAAGGQVQEWKERYEALVRELEGVPLEQRPRRWYKDLTQAFNRMRWNARVAARREHEQLHPTHPVEVHVTRLGEAVFATNPFELYLDFGMQMRARSRAGQTFLVQLAGPGTYLPTRRAVEGGAYGAVAASTIVGPEAGRELVEETLALIDSLWET